ncbi:hypothetical protein GIB67_005521 [Kingdonia uniflora]|uniref:Uncharacterized protein n=1 Tax=Kingdonia uniflora TaxID=39325 RepID=A0A7J7NHF6_9MAGN|nr:hypothetical protein GIB67_005521 [Kingdonia uniflora]
MGEFEPKQGKFTNPPCHVILHLAVADALTNSYKCNKIHLTLTTKNSAQIIS